MRWGDDMVRFASQRSGSPWSHVSWKKAARWRRTGMCSARFEFRGNSAEQAKEEDACTLVEMTTLVDDLFRLNEAVNEANKGIGADVRNRVDVLYNRATLLKYSADNMVAAGGRVPVQLTATLKVQHFLLFPHNTPQLCRSPMHLFCWVRIFAWIRSSV